MRFPAFPALFPKSVRATTVVCLLGGILATPAQAIDWKVLTADDLPAHVEFARRLRDGADPGQRVDFMHTAPGPGAAADALAQAGEDQANAGVRTRSLRRGATSAETVTVAVGAVAARVALERAGPEPLLLAMLSRPDYEGLKPLPGWRRGERRIGVLLREPAMSDQLALIDAVLPGKRRLGLVVAGESEPLLRELQAAAKDWQLQVEYAPDARALGAALRKLVPFSDALIVMPDLIGDNQAAMLAVMRAGAAASIPVFGSSEGMVRSGALAVAVSTPDQLAHQARSMGARLASAGGEPLLVENATPATVRVNATVARGLNLRLPSEQALTERIAARR